MKTIIKLLIAIAILNAAARAGLATAKYYEFKDAVQQLVTFGGDAAPSALQNEIMEKATDLEVPIGYDDVEVVRNGKLTTATAAYTDEVEVFPSYKYPIAFHFSVEGLKLGSGVETHE